MTRAQQAHRAEWATRPERSSMLVLRLMVWLSLKLGRRLSRLILYPIAAYFVVFAPSAKRASKAFLGRALGRTARVKDGFRHVLTFASVVHDRVYWLRGRNDLFDITVSGEHHIAALRQQGRGIVFAGGHFGSFEALRVIGERHGVDAKMLMFPDNARKVTAALTAINPALADSVIALGRPESVLRVRDHLESGGSVGILADRMLEGDKCREVAFLGQPAPFPIGPWRLASMLGAPVVFMAGCYLGGNRYHLVFEPVVDFAQVSPQQRTAAIDAAQQRFAALLEARCHEAPWNWFNFYDFWNNPT
ncbi:acyl-CoA synthetase [Ottowia testudinis]|uniref:Acyl-CoA synthetase n=1 Tax=Ottowia testudinis TaxID=2816950 RepID=A0A975CC18_9BURK|nr:acyl-CoA synthetase [Ottowia testudinis]QTD43688.1 acyl-CoA synthetase [Ottowia testudinis]